MTNEERKEAENLAMIADLWNYYIYEKSEKNIWPELSKVDVAAMLTLLNIARVAENQMGKKE